MEKKERKKKDEKELALAKIISSLNEKHRKGTSETQPLITRLGDHPELFDIKFIPTNVPEINSALGGGIPRGAMTVITGTEGCGKTSLAMSCADHVLKTGGNVLYINTETVFPHVSADTVGINKNSLLIASPHDFGEQLLNVIEEALFDNSSRTARDVLDLIIIDSINGLVPKAIVDKAEKEGAEGMDVGVRARMLSKFTERVMGKGLLRQGSAMILIAQQRVDIGSYGAPLVMSGGKALRYNPKVIISLRKRMIKSADAVLGHEVHFEVEKNGVSGYPTKGMYNIVYGIGVDDSLDVFNKAQELGVISKEGRSDYIFRLLDGDLKVSGGINAAREKVRTDVDLKTKLKDQIERAMNNKEKRKDD